LSFSPDGHTLAISTFSHGAYVALYAMPARKLISKLPIGALAGLAFSPDGKTLATMSVKTGTVNLWNAATGQLTGTLPTGLRITSLGSNIAFSPDGTLLAVSGTINTTMQVWSVARLTKVATVGVIQGTQYPAQLGGGVLAMAFSGNGRLLALDGLDGVIRLYSVPGFTFAGSFQPPASTDTLAFSPDGRDLALGSASGTVYLYWVPTTGSPVPKAGSLTGNIPEAGALSASSKAIHGLEFTSDTTLIAAGDDGVARFWSVPDAAVLKAYALSPTALFTAATPGQLIATHAGAIASVSYSAPLGLLATGSSSGSRVWRTDPGTVAASVCPALQAPVQLIQWTEYLGAGIPYNRVCS
jgi:WD40 repeat protein